MLSFCKSCNNLYTYVTTPENKLIMKCQSCGRPDDAIKDNCVYFNKFIQSSYNIKIDPDQCHDPTLPNTDQIPCLNKQTCPSNNPGYILFIQDKKQTELGNQYTAEAAERVFMERGGNTGQWLLDAWNSLLPAEQTEYNNKADNIKDSVDPRIVFFHYNKEKKLAYICCLCKRYWKN